MTMWTEQHKCSTETQKNSDTERLTGLGHLERDRGIHGHTRHVCGCPGLCKILENLLWGVLRSSPLFTFGLSKVALRSPSCWKPAMKYEPAKTSNRHQILKKKDAEWGFGLSSNFIMVNLWIIISLNLRPNLFLYVIMRNHSLGHSCPCYTW